MSCFGERAFRHIKHESVSLGDSRISVFFNTKFIAVALIEPILHKFEDLKNANFFNPEEVYFLVTRVKYYCWVGVGWVRSVKTSVYIWRYSLSPSQAKIK